MKNCVSFDTSTERATEKLSSGRIMIGKENNSGALSFLKKGQQITGTVVAVGEQVTLDFDGQKVAASKDILKDAVVGDEKTFEVIKAFANELELRLIETTTSTFKQMMKATMVKDTDWSSLKEQKDQASKQADKDREVKDSKTKLEEIKSKLTTLDYQKLEKEGFPLENFSLSGLLKAISRMKDGSTITNINSGIGSALKSGEDISSRLKLENLPDTEENIARVEKALDLSKAAVRMDDYAMKYLISQNAVPSIENIYKACFSANAKIQEPCRALSEQAWSEMAPQVNSIITSAGYEVNQENIQEAKWLLDNNLPLTKETLAYKKELNSIKSNSDQDSVLRQIMDGMKKGILPMEITLAVKQGITPEQVITDIDSIRDDTISYAVQNKAELTIKNLVSIQEKRSDGRNFDPESRISEAGKETDVILPENKESSLDSEEKTDASIETEATSDMGLEEIRARRQMEEIRLKMTLEAAAKLEKKGFTIETQLLEKVVEALKELEDSYYWERLSEADVQPSELQIQTLKETTNSLDLLKSMPCTVLGSTLSNRFSQTIPSLLTEGNRLMREYAKAGTAYETLMTVPNSGYGDSIQKAFSNSQSLLSGLNLSDTEQNRRAVRILGYNQMDITAEAIDMVKAYNQEVNTLIQNLHPAVTVRMIKEGQNPLEMPIYELNNMIDKMKEELGITSEDKFSTYLQRLQKEDSISEEERKAYIGIYRLLYQVDKSDGAAVGAVVKAQGEVTLNRLLTAIQTNKKGRLDAVIDDEFGMLQEINRDKESITEQLSSFLGQQASEDESNETALEEKIRYLCRVLKQGKDELTPEKLQEVGLKLTEAGVTSQPGTGTADSLYSTVPGIWEAVKDVPAEELLRQIQNTAGIQEEAEDEAYATKVQELRKLCNNSEQALRFLSDFQESATPMNIMIASHILSNGLSPFTKLLKRKDENAAEISENGIKEMNELSDNLIDRSSMNEAYEKLEESAKDLLSQAYSEEKIDSQRLAELKSIGQQRTFIKTLAKKEFYQIPVETDQGITNINLTILRGTGSAGKMLVTAGSEVIGNMKAEFVLKGMSVNGLISCDNRSGLEKLQSCSREIENAAKEYGVTIKQLGFGILSRDIDNYSYQNPMMNQSTETVDSVERILYRIAKAVVKTVQAAHKTDTN